MGSEYNMELIAEVDSGLCMSSGKCVVDEPTVFRFDEDEVAEPTGTTAGVDRERLIDLAYNCPAGAITIKNSAGEVLAG
jgi:ferredoxin